MLATRFFVPAILLATAAAAPVQAVRGSPRPYPAAIISFADLDLATRAGVAKLDRRLAQAVREVCSSFGRYSAREVDETQRCRTATRANLQARRAQVIAAARSGAIRLSER
jgi:UrcA family protein